MEIFRSFFEWSWPILGGVIAWFVLEFAAKPYLRFRTLRSVIQTQQLKLETTILVVLTAHHPDRASMIAAHNAEIDQIASDLRDSGIALFVMADTEHLLSGLLSVLGYEIRTCASALLALQMAAAKRDIKSLMPPLDDKGDKLLSIVRETLRLPKIRLY
jgi:hypothetical protein